VNRRRGIELDSLASSRTCKSDVSEVLDCGDAAKKFRTQDRDGFVLGKIDEKKWIIFFDPSFSNSSIIVSCDSAFQRAKTSICTMLLRHIERPQEIFDLAQNIAAHDHEQMPVSVGKKWSISSLFQCRCASNLELRRRDDKGGSEQTAGTIRGGDLNAPCDAS